MRFILKSITTLAISVVLFVAMQLAFGDPNCFDCGAKVGFPFRYMQGGTYGTYGRFLWAGFIGDYAVSLCVGTLIVWAFARWRNSR
jgi:hypothetical protein